MSTTTDTTTLICLFHHDDQAKAALEDLQEAGIPTSSITTLRGGESATSGELTALGIPSRDLDHLQKGLNDGGSILSVSATTDHESIVERIFGDHRAAKIDEVDNEREYENTALPVAASLPVAAAATGETVIPIVEEELSVGKRTVDQGGVRVYRRVVEIPVEQAVNLREEHVVIERNPVNRAATSADLAAQGNRTIELTETAEEAVVGKNARVVEEVLIGKQTGERTETIHDTVRRTEVELEELPAETTTPLTR